jgi:hypothetical protein
LWRMYQLNGIRIADVLRIKGDTLKMEVDSICYEAYLASELQHDTQAQNNKNNADGQTIDNLENLLNRLPNRQKVR